MFLAVWPVNTFQNFITFGFWRFPYWKKLKSFAAFAIAQLYLFLDVLVLAVSLAILAVFKMFKYYNSKTQSGPLLMRV